MTTGDLTPVRPERPERRALTAVGLLALVVSALVGGNVAHARDRLLGSATPRPASPALSRQAGAPGPTVAPAISGASAPTTKPTDTSLRSEPWWQAVTTLDGSGPMVGPAFPVDPGSIQWRVKWDCQTGHLVVRATGRPRPVVDHSCPGSGTGYATQRGNQNLQVGADGPWHLKIDQQVDVPLIEPPLPVMTAPGTRSVAAGSLYRIDQSGSGRVTIYHSADGADSLRLDDFFVSPNIDLEIRLSPLEAPRSTDQYLAAAPSDAVAPLDITAGSLNFAVPATIDPTKYRSVVIWCPDLHSAYAAATLVRR